MSIAIIPARGGSVRIPRKNIRAFHGKPIIAYSIEAAQDSRLFSDVIVSTDDLEIEEIAVRYGAIVLRRGLDDGTRGTQEVAKDVLDTLDYDGPVCVIYPTAPMLTGETLRKALLAWRVPFAPYVVPVATWLQDPGQFYLGEAWAFRQSIPLIRAQMFQIDPRTECDINTIDDWHKAEEMFAALYPEGKECSIQGK